MEANCYKIIKPHKGSGFKVIVCTPNTEDDSRDATHYFSTGAEALIFVASALGLDKETTDDFFSGSTTVAVSDSQGGK